MAEFVKKTDGSNVKLRVRKGVVADNDPDGLVAFIKSFKTNFDPFVRGHLLELQLFVTDEDAARAGGFAPHIYNGGKIRITLVKDGVSAIPLLGNAGEIEAIVVPPKADEDESEPVGDEEHDEDYEEDTEGPPPVIPPASEPGATEQANQKDDKYKPDSGEATRASAEKEERVRMLAERLKMIDDPSGF